jgi:hypothetical protein
VFYIIQVLALINSTDYRAAVSNMEVTTGPGDACYYNKKSFSVLGMNDI